jgi:hypothetical protein
MVTATAIPVLAQPPVVTAVVVCSDNPLVNIPPMQMATATATPVPSMPPAVRPPQPPKASAGKN